MTTTLQNEEAMPLELELIRVPEESVEIALSKSADKEKDNRDSLDSSDKEAKSLTDQASDQAIESESNIIKPDVNTSTVSTGLEYNDVDLGFVEEYDSDTDVDDEIEVTGVEPDGSENVTSINLDVALGDVPPLPSLPERDNGPDDVLADDLFDRAVSSALMSQPRQKNSKGISKLLKGKSERPLIVNMDESLYHDPLPHPVFHPKGVAPSSRVSGAFDIGRPSKSPIALTGEKIRN